MFESEFFAGLRTLAEVKATFKKLVKIHHPDVGGDCATMQRLNAEYEKAVAYFAKYGDNAEREQAAQEVPQEYAAAVAAAVNLKGVILEMVGSWIWASGNTRANKEALKAAGYMWSNKRKMWFWHPADEKHKSGHSKKSMEWIKAKYGSERITENTKTHKPTRPVLA